MSGIVYQPPDGVESETDICNNFDNFLKSVKTSGKTHSEKIAIYDYIVKKANEALKEALTVTNQTTIYISNFILLWIMFKVIHL